MLQNKKYHDRKIWLNHYSTWDYQINLRTLVVSCHAYKTSFKRTNISEFRWCQTNCIEGFSCLWWSQYFSCLMRGISPMHKIVLKAWGDALQSMKLSLKSWMFQCCSLHQCKTMNREEGASIAGGRSLSGPVNGQLYIYDG